MKPKKLKEFKADKYNCKKELSSLFVKFINSQDIPEHIKILLKQNCDSFFVELNDYEIRNTIKNSIYYAYYDWKRENFEIIDLYKNILLNASKHSSEPFVIAEISIDEFVKNFVDTKI